MSQLSRPGRTLTCKEALQLLLDQVDFTAGACSLTDMVGQCVPKGVFEQCRAAIAAASEKPAQEPQIWRDEALMEAASIVDSYIGCDNISEKIRALLGKPKEYSMDSQSDKTVEVIPTPRTDEAIGQGGGSSYNAIVMRCERVIACSRALEQLATRWQQIANQRAVEVADLRHHADIASRSAEHAQQDGWCRGCKGSGTVMGMTHGHEPDDYEVEVECPTCKGTGAGVPSAPSSARAQQPEGWVRYKDSGMSTFFEGSEMPDLKIYGSGWIALYREPVAPISASDTPVLKSEWQEAMELLREAFNKSDLDGRWHEEVEAFLRRAEGRDA